MLQVRIRQRPREGQVGNEARVSRVLALDDRLYVDVEHTVDVTEPRLMAAVTAAVNRFVAERDHSEKHKDEPQQDQNHQN